MMEKWNFTDEFLKHPSSKNHNINKKIATYLGVEEEKVNTYLGNQAGTIGLKKMPKKTMNLPAKICEISIGME